MNNLFGDDNPVIRTLGFYPPFGALMLHGKIETRWVEDGRKPPFPEGKYLIYNTKSGCDKETIIRWCGQDIMQLIKDTLRDEPSSDLLGHAIAIGELVTKRPLTFADERMAFVLFQGLKHKFNEEGLVTKIYRQLGFWFENVQRIEPFEFNFGKQGVGILKDSERAKIKVIG